MASFEVIRYFQFQLRYGVQICLYSENFNSLRFLVIGNFQKLFFNCLDEYEYPDIHVTISSDLIFSFYLIDNWTNDYFSLSDDDKIDSSHQTVKVFSLNSDQNNFYQE
jgi:hypothetical protein